MEMEDQYGISDLRQFMNGRTHFPAITQPTDLYTGTQTYDMLMIQRGMQHEHRQPLISSEYNPTGMSVMEADTGADGGSGRWPRQETLTLLEIRSRLDPKFKEANQKGPLWDEVSRILSEEHGYQRSGKKCREKFENLYKYYKKTKEGKAGRQDGKHYRFFRQLDALYGEPNSHPTPHPSLFPAKLSDSLSMSNNSTSENLDTSSSDYEEDDSVNKKGKSRKRRSWKAKIREFVDSQMQRLMERQEGWLEKMLSTMQRREQDRMLREEEWRRLETQRLEREHRLWAEERAWIKARDAALMEALHKLTHMGSTKPKRINEAEDEGGGEIDKWDGFVSGKKRKESEEYYYPRVEENVYGEIERSQLNETSSGCFRFMMGDGGEGLWESYGKMKGSS